MTRGWIVKETPKAKRSSRKPIKATTKKPVKAKKSRSTKASENEPKTTGNEKPVASSKGTKGSGDSSSLTWLAITFVAIGMAVLFYASGFQLNDTTISENMHESAKPKPNPSIGGPFSLVDQDGNGVTDMDFRGQYLLIYFGYTYCPDVCPTSLTDMSDALEELGDEASKVTPILITIDPARDTPEHLKEYASFFHPRLRALTGTREQISAAAKAYRVYFNKTKQAGAGPDDYLMDHSSAIYLMGPDGDFRSHFTHGTSPGIIAQRIQDILS